MHKSYLPPDFFLLFSTIHYEKHGGFQRLLDGVWSVLPEGTPLVGGTVAGFMNNYGVYVHGATALAVSYPNMDVAIGYGKNTKRNPKKAVQTIVEMINRGLKSSPYQNKFLLNFVSSAELMKIPGRGYKKIINSGFMSKFVTLTFSFSQYFLQKGPGREDEIFELFAKELHDYYMILGTTVDEYRGIKSYQFFNEKIFTNSIVCLGLATDLNLDVCTTHGMNKTNIEFKITKLSKDGHIIRKINKKSAVPELLRLLDWPEGFLNEKTMFYRILYYPISVKRHNRNIPVVMPFILKDSIVTPCKIEEGDATVLTVSGKGLITAIKNNLKNYEYIQPEFGLFSTCGTILQTLGYSTNIIREEILHFFNEKPFVMFFCAGEGTYSPINNINYANMSYNTAIFGYDKKIIR